MEEIFDEIVREEDLKKFEKIYIEQSSRGPPSAKATFEYAWCLVRSRRQEDLHRGVILLEELYHKTSDEAAKRDYLFYLSVGNARLKKYEKALKFANAILHVEPSNHQAMELREHIKNKMRKEGLIGMAVVGGIAAVAVGGIAALGVALSRK